MRSVAPYDRRDIFGSFHLVKSPNKVLMLINEKEINYVQFMYKKENQISRRNNYAIR